MIGAMKRPERGSLPPRGRTITGLAPFTPRRKTLISSASGAPRPSLQSAISRRSTLWPFCWKSASITTVPALPRTVRRVLIAVSPSISTAAAWIAHSRIFGLLNAVADGGLHGARGQLAVPFVIEIRG